MNTTDLLSKQQIRRICFDNDFDYRITKRPARDCGVDLRIARDPRYARGNLIEVCHDGQWHTLGWLWDIESCAKSQIVRRLNEIREAQ